MDDRRTELALTPEQWQRRRVPASEVDWHPGFEWDDRLVEIECGDEYDVHVEGIHRHRVAAACLHAQPFGFTREDVSDLLLAARDCHADYADRYESLAARIAALLPPEAS